MRYVAVWNNSHQYFEGTLAWAKRINPVSIICLCFLSTLRDVKTQFLIVLKGLWRFCILLPNQTTEVFIFLSNLFPNNILNWMKIFNLLDFYLMGYIHTNLLKSSRKVMWYLKTNVDWIGAYSHTFVCISSKRAFACEVDKENGNRWAFLYQQASQNDMISLIFTFWLHALSIRDTT